MDGRQPMNLWRACKPISATRCDKKKLIVGSPDFVIFYLILGSLQHVFPGLSSCWYCGAGVAHFSTQSCVVIKSNDDIQNS
jgi:hypothetical protein